MNKQKLKGLWIPADRVSKIISSLRDKNYIKVKLKYKTDSKEIEQRQITPIVENINRYSQKCLESIDTNNYSDSQKQWIGYMQIECKKICYRKTLMLV